MKGLSIFCTIIFVILAVGQAFALPGVYNAGASTMNLDIGRCETRTISMNGTGWSASPLVSGGFLMQNSNNTVVNIADCQCYDIWDSPPSIEFNPTGYPGGLFVALANLGAGVVPSANILMCDVELCGVLLGSSTITIDTDPQWDTWLAQDFTIYDSTIDAAAIVVEVGYIPPCECSIAGPIEVQANVSGDSVTASYHTSSFGLCDNPTLYEYSDDCVHGSIDSNTGVLTVPAFTSCPDETCTITVTDTANIDINTGDPIVCTLDIAILAGTCECEGNFDGDQDVDGTDAARFKIDFGRKSPSNPCTDGLPCNGDFSCDGDVDGTDAAIFKQDFGRKPPGSACPSCEREPWCVY